MADVQATEDLDQKITSVKPSFFQRMRNKAGTVAGTLALTMAASAPLALLGPRPLFADEPVTVEYVVPGASSSGVGGSNWQTNIRGYNPSNEIADFTIAGIKNNQTEPIATANISINPGCSVNLEDVARNELGLAKFSGMFKITAPEGVEFISRTENHVDSSVVGLSVPTQAMEAYPANTRTVTIVYPNVEDYRVNLWAATKEENQLTITFRSMDTIQHHEDLDPGVIDVMSLPLLAGQTRQLGDILTPLYWEAKKKLMGQELTADYWKREEDKNDPTTKMLKRGESLKELRTDITDGERPIAMLVTGTAPFNLGASIIDDRGAQDPLWFTPAVDYKKIVDTVGADTTGANNSEWKTRIIGWNPHTERYRLDFWFYPEEGGIYTAFSSADALNGFVFEDIFDELFRPQNPDFPAGNVKGKLEGSLCNKGAYANVSIWNKNPDESTSAQGMDLVQRLDAIGGFRQGVLFGLSNNEDTRTNIGIYDANGQVEAVFRVTVVNGDNGDQLWTNTYIIQPNEWMQLNNLLGRKFGGEDPIYEGNNAIVFIQPLIGTVHAYATEIANEPALPEDEKHNDPSYQAALRMEPPFQGLDMVIKGDKTEVNPIIDDVFFRLWGRNGHMYGNKITKITGDIDRDGEDDFTWSYDSGAAKQIIYEEFNQVFDGRFSGQIARPVYKIHGVHYDQASGQNVTEIFNVTKTIDVAKVSSLGMDWKTIADYETEVNQMIQDNQAELVGLLSSGPGAPTPAQVQDFFNNATGCETARYTLSDDDMTIAADACGYEATLGPNNNPEANDEVIEHFAPWLEYAGPGSGDEPSAAAYVGKWFPPGGGYLANHEAREMVDLYSTEMSEILARATNNTSGATASDVKDWLIMMADGQVLSVTDDFYSGFDPMNLDANGVRFHAEPDGDGTSNFNLTPEDKQQFYNLTRDQFLVEYVGANKHLYSCDGSSTLDWDCDPTWNSQDSNP